MHMCKVFLNNLQKYTEILEIIYRICYYKLTAYGNELFPSLPFRQCLKFIYHSTFLAHFTNTSEWRLSWDIAVIYWII